MRQFIISFLIVFLPTLLFGQTITLNVEKIGDSLRTVGIDTFIVFKNYFPGSYHCLTLDSDASEDEILKAFCEKADAVYVLYKLKGQLFIQKRNECFFFKTISIDSSKAFTFFINDFDKIVNEKILTNSYIDKNGDTLYVSIDHSDMIDLYLSRGTTKKTLTLDWFDLQPTNDITENAKGNNNINYEHNIKTNTKYLILLITDKLSSQTFTKD